MAEKRRHASGWRSARSSVAAVLITVGPLAALGCGAVLADRSPAYSVLALVFGTAYWQARKPGSVAGIISAVSVLTWWAVRVDSTALFSGPDALEALALTLVAVVALTAAHVSATLGDYAPRMTALSARLVRRWLGRGVLMVSASALVALVVAATAGASSGSDLLEVWGRVAWLVGAAVGAVALVAAGVALQRARRLTDGVEGSNRPASAAPPNLSPVLKLWKEGDRVDRPGAPLDKKR